MRRGYAAGWTNLAQEYPMRKFVLASFAAFVCVPALCQQAFPDGATAPSAQEVQGLLAEKTFRSTLANGTVWRMQYNSNGYMFFNAGAGYNDSGKWRAEDGRLCTEMHRTGASCADVRLSSGTLYLKRTSGEIIRFEPQ
jgi:YD repeat-containing protein